MKHVDDSYGFIRVASTIPSVKIGDCDYNAQSIISMARKASEEGASIVAFPELSITGYTCADLFGQPFLLNRALIALQLIAEQTSSLKTAVIVGLPIDRKSVV